MKSSKPPPKVPSASPWMRSSPGDQTTLAGVYDFVWKEAVAEYLVYAHQDQHISATAAFKSLGAWKQFSAFSEYYLVPAEEPPLLDYYGDVYGPGPMILFRQLEAIFDRQTVLMALSSLLGSPRAISIDGREDHPLAVGDTVHVRALERPLRLVEPSDAQPFWDLLRQKAELLPA